MESFNGKLRNECLNEEPFWSRAEAQVVVDWWRRVYNTERPHWSLHFQTPAEGSGASQIRVRNSSAGTNTGVSSARAISGGIGGAIEGGIPGAIGGAFAGGIVGGVAGIVTLPIPATAGVAGAVTGSLVGTFIGEIFGPTTMGHGEREIIPSFRNPPDELPLIPVPGFDPNDPAVCLR